jgi:hypothetical protein
MATIVFSLDENHQFLVCELTTPEVGDPTAMPDLLDQTTADFETFIMDTPTMASPFLRRF